MPVCLQTTKISIFSKTLYGLLGARKSLGIIFSGAKADRPGLNSAMEIARAGDTLVVWRLDRLGRSLKDLIELTEALRERLIGLHSLQESIDTTSSSGQLILHMFGALAEFDSRKNPGGVDCGES